MHQLCEIAVIDCLAATNSPLSHDRLQSCSISSLWCHAGLCHDNNWFAARAEALQECKTSAIVVHATCAPPQQELEKALSKHEIIGVKALAQKTKASPSSSSSGSPGRNSPAARSSTCSSPGAGSSSSASRAIAEFKRGIRDTEAEAAATQQRLQQLRNSKAQLQAATGCAAAAWQQLQQEQAQLRSETVQAQAAR
jgi:hypothetical protein